MVNGHHHALASQSSRDVRPRFTSCVVPLLTPEYRESALPVFFETSLASKARMNDELRAALVSLRKQAGVDERALIEQLQSIWTQTSALMSEGPGNRPVEAYRNDYEELHRREDDLVAKISAKSEAFRVAIQEPAAADVALHLGQAVLVDVVRIARWHTNPGIKLSAGDLVYLATILFGDGHMDAVELGDAKPIDDLVAGYRLAQEVTDNQVALKVLAERLGRKVLDPLTKLAGEHQDWYLSPDGPLRLIPFGALLLPDGTYAAQRYRFWSLSSGRDLLTPATKLPAGSLDLVLANPDYGSARDGGFAALPETEEEARAIRKAFPNARLLEAGKRSKQNLLALDQPPRILHLATHGYFQKEGVGDALLRAGIALDGANLGPDGLLTAKEAQNLRLNGTSLVVLSACDTGIGDVSFSEGLSGLQRSLALVGARTQLLTLWPVNSARTKDFMEQFYGRLAAGKTKGNAWIETQREMIRQGFAPHVWAPFVLYGDPGAL